MNKEQFLKSIACHLKFSIENYLNYANFYYSNDSYHLNKIFRTVKQHYSRACDILIMILSEKKLQSDEFSDLPDFQNYGEALDWAKKIIKQSGSLNDQK